MKKIFTLVSLSLIYVVTAGAQTFNLFPNEDVDANGWLWFDTAEKISKYVGLCDEDNYTVDPNGKVVQMAFANITPDYPETIASADAIGVGTDSEFGSEGAIKGAVIMAPSSAQMTANGGVIILNLPSCSSIGLYLSSEYSMMGRTLMLTPGKDMSIDDSPAGADSWTGSTKVIYTRATVFGKLSNAGHFKWETAATQNNGNNTDVTFVSDNAVYFGLQNCNRYPIYVHGIKVTTPKQETLGVKGIAAVTDDDMARVYSLDGKYMGLRDADKNLAKGIYVVKHGDKTRKVIAK